MKETEKKKFTTSLHVMRMHCVAVRTVAVRTYILTFRPILLFWGSAFTAFSYSTNNQMTTLKTINITIQKMTNQMTTKVVA
jgi:hypothetical protein